MDDLMHYIELEKDEDELEDLRKRLEKNKSVGDETRIIDDEEIKRRRDYARKINQASQNRQADLSNNNGHSQGKTSYKTRPKQTNKPHSHIDKKNVGGSKKPKRKVTKRKKQKKKTGKIILIVLATIIALILLLLGYFFIKYGKLNKKDIKGIKTYHKTKGYTNIALFGLDSREGETDEGVRSDTIMIASIKNSTKEVKLTSVYRDTFLEIEKDEYGKINSAYSYGGAKQAINALNKNLDLDIEYYFAINFDALVEAVDAVGGIELDLTGEECYWLNGYQVETAKASNKLEEVKDLPVADGRYKLNGVQATSYCRIRYTDGNDYKRTWRQRTVLKALMKKAMSNPLTINKLINKTFPHVTTNISSVKFLSMAIFAFMYHTDKSEAFPHEVKDYDTLYNYEGSYVLPDDLEANVVYFHKKTFGEKNYKPSSALKEISDYIKEQAYY